MNLDHDLVEQEADAIAYELLMPQKKVRACIDFGMSLREMAFMFGVEESRMALRLDRLGVRWL